MKDQKITLSLDYLETVRLKRHRNFTRVIFAEDVPIMVREVALTDAPVAYHFTSKERSFDTRKPVERRYKVRLCNERLWWPLRTSGSSRMTLFRFKKLALKGDLNEFMTSETLPWPFFPCPRAQFFAENMVADFGTSNFAERLTKVERMAFRLMICEGQIYVEGGEPIWYATGRPANFAISIGPESWDLWESWLPGPDRETRLACCKRGLAFGLDEMKTETAQMIARGAKIEVRSSIKPKIDLDTRETAVVLCARSLVESLWQDVNARRSLFSRDERQSRSALRPPAGLDYRQVLARLVTSTDVELKQRIETFAAERILARLDAFTCGALRFGDGTFSLEDDAAIASLSIPPD